MKRFAFLLILIFAGSSTVSYGQRIVDRTVETICDCLNERQSDTIAFGDLVPKCAQEAFEIHREKLEKEFGAPIEQGSGPYQQMTKVVVNALLSDCPLFAEYIADESDLTDWRSECDSLIREGKLSDAYDLATKVVKEDPSNHIAYFMRGKIYAQDEQYYRAVVQFLEAISIKSDYLQAYTEMATAKSNVNDLEGAYNAIQTALEIDSTWADAYNTLGTLYYKIEEYADAAAQFRKAVQYDNQNALYRYNLGVSLQDIDENEASVKVLSSLLTDYPEDASVYYELGNAWFSLDEVPKSIEYYEKACELNPENPSYCDNAGFAYLQLEQYNKAIQYFEKSLELYPDDPEVIFTKGTAWFYLENYEMALADFNSAIALNATDYPGFYDFKGKALKKMERFKEAISSFTKSLELYPDDCEILKERMECFEVLLDEESAEADRQQMFSLGCEEVN